MTDRWTDPAVQDVHRGLFTAAAVMIAAGAAVWLAGLATGAIGVIVSGKRWTRRVELSPNDLARLKWAQARAAMGAGAGAWRENDQTKSSH
jgi:hypothetical protein